MVRGGNDSILPVVLALLYIFLLLAVILANGLPVFLGQLAIECVLDPEAKHPPPERHIAEVLIGGVFDIELGNAERVEQLALPLRLAALDGSEQEVVDE